MFRWQTIVMTLIFSVAAGLLGGRLGILRAIELYPGPVSGGINLAIKQALNGRIDLSKEQTEKIAEIQRQHELVRARLRAESKAANFEFAKAMNSAQEDNLAGSPQVSSALDRLSATGRALQEESVSYADKVRRTLTPAQRALADEEINKVLVNIAERT